MIPSQEKRTNAIGVLVLIGTVLAGYMASLLGDDLATREPLRFWLLLGLGLLFSLNLTLGASWYERREANRWSAPLYFGSQVLLYFIILYLGQIRSFWIIALPLAGQSTGLRSWGLVGVTATLYLGTLGVLGVLAGPFSFSEYVTTFLGILAAYTFVVLFSYMTVRTQVANTQIEGLARQLATANEQLRAYALKIEDLAIERERNRMAREIHDSLGHYLTVVNMQLEAARTVLTTDPTLALEAVDKAQSVTQEGLAEVRRSVASLRGTPLQNRSLEEAIGDLVAGSNATGIVTTLTVTGDPRPLSVQTALTLYRAAQETLTNVRKHANASRADLLLAYGAAGQVNLTITDNGVGTDRPDGGFGLLGLRERVQQLQGRVEIRTARGQGFTLELLVPG